MTPPVPGNVVRLTEAAMGMAPGSRGVLIGWYREPGVEQALVKFWDGGPIKVPAELIERLCADS